MAKRVVLVGAGHAQLYTLRRTSELVRRGHEVVAVAPDLFWYSGLATGMLGGLYPPELDQVDVQALVEGGGGRFLCDGVVAIDREVREVVMAGGGRLGYDALSLTIGSVAPAIPGEEKLETAFTVKPVRRLWELRRALEARFRGGDMVRVAIAGGGATGCELAGNIAALAERAGGKVLVLVLGAELLRELPPRARGNVVASLAGRGIAFRTRVHVARVEAGRAILDDGEAVAFDLFVNATGLQPSPLAASSGLPVDRQGALVVDAHLRAPADPAIHGAGDCVALQGHALPRIGVYAIRQAPVLFHNLLAALEGTKPARFVPQRRFLWIMNLGDGTGVAARGRLYWRGRAAFLLKDRIDRSFLAEYRVERG
jgi:NADH dehydrogenase FAD-containing subunit